MSDLEDSIGPVKGSLYGSAAALAALREMESLNLPVVSTKPQLSEAESASLIKHFARKSKVPLRINNIPIRYAGESFSLDRPQLGDHIVQAPLKSYVLAHELGHATSPMLKLHRATRSLSNVLLGSLLLSYPLTKAYEAYAKARNPEGYAEKDHKELDALNTAGLTANAVQLGEEAQATLRGAYAIGKISGAAKGLKALASLSPAYGTYLAAFLAAHKLAPAAAGWYGKKFSIEGDNDAS